MTLRPSETQEGQLWLSNFKVEERHAAELLINSLHVISATAFRASMSGLLNDLKLNCERPIVFFPIRELPKGMAPSTGTPKQSAPVEQLPDGSYMSLLPLDEPFESLPGSEGIVGNIIRDVLGYRPKSTVASSPQTLARLRSAQPRTIVLVEDYSGTGTRVSGYIDSWMKHPTIRSWYSYGLIRFHVALVSASGSALEKMKRHRRIADIHYCEQAADFSTAMWSLEELVAIEEICLKYAFSSNYALGFQSAGGLLVLQHTVPNNLPAILWQPSAKTVQDWKPFFKDRRMSPQQQLDLDDYKLEVDAAAIAESMRQFKLGVALSDQPNPTLRMILLVLASAAQRIRDPAKLSVMLRTTLAAAEQTQNACRALKLLDQEGRLTDLGRNELRRARTRTSDIKRNRLRGSEGFYYPTQLRGVSDI